MQGPRGLPGADGAAGARGPSDVLVRRLAPIAAISQTMDASAVFTTFTLPSTFEAEPSPVLFEATGSFANMSGANRTVTCSAMRNAVPVDAVSGKPAVNAVQDFGVPFDDARVPLRGPDRRTVR